MYSPDPFKRLYKLPGADPQLVDHYYAQYRKRLRKLGFVDPSGAADESRLSREAQAPEAGIVSAERGGKSIDLKAGLRACTIISVASQS